MSQDGKDGILTLLNGDVIRAEDIPFAYANRIHEEFCALDNRKKKRELVVEWWEIWNERNLLQPQRIFPEADEMAGDTRVPAHGFPTKESVDNRLKTTQGPYLRVVHVRRTRKAKKIS